MAWTDPPALKAKPRHPVGALQKPKQSAAILWGTTLLWMGLLVGLTLLVWVLRWVIWLPGDFFPKGSRAWILFSLVVGFAIGRYLGWRLVLYVSYVLTASSTKAYPDRH